MMSQGGARDLDLLLDLADGEAARPCSDKQLKDLQAMRMAKLREASRRLGEDRRCRRLH